jgi:two-component system phosphate regulon sensor histidine kinase PhoR
MKTPDIPRRLNAQDMTVILAVSAISLLALSATLNAPILPTLCIITLSSAAIMLYGNLAQPSDTTTLSRRDTLQSENDFMEAQASLADNISDAVIMIDAKERVIYANGAARALHNISILGRPLSTYVREPGVRGVIAEALRGGTPQPITYETEDTTLRYIRLMASSFIWSTDDEDRPMALLFFYDMTEYVLADSQKADFLANASHELKTPIASLLGYIETLQGHAKNDPKAREKFLGIMQSQAERMQRLINDLLSLRRIEQNEHIAPSDIADLYIAVKAALETVQPLAKKRKIDIALSAQTELLVSGDQDELIQLVLNLLDNAVKISPEDSAINISVALSKEWLPGKAFAGSHFSSAAANRRIVLPPNPKAAFYILKLRDNGPGFSREHLPRIGERFYRIAGDLSSKEKGTGLGLAIVKHITRRHRGGLLIQSAPDEGTEFTVLIPAKDSPDTQDI